MMKIKGEEERRDKIQLHRTVVDEYIFGNLRHYQESLGCAMGSWVYDPCVHNPTHGLCPKGRKPNRANPTQKPMGTRK